MADGLIMYVNFPALYAGLSFVNSPAFDAGMLRSFCRIINKILTIKPNFNDYGKD